MPGSAPLPIIGWPMPREATPPPGQTEEADENNDKSECIYWFFFRDGKESACRVGDPGSIPALGRSPGEGNGYPLQYSCLENPMDRGAWRATVHGVGHNWATLEMKKLSHFRDEERGLQRLSSQPKVIKAVSPIPRSVLFCECVCVCVCVCVTQSSPTLCKPTDCIPQGSSVHGTSQARTLERVAIPFSRGTSQPGDWTHVSCIACPGRWILCCCTNWEVSAEIRLNSHY